MKYKLNATHKDNLEKLSRYLQNTTELKAKFDMAYYLDFCNGYNSTCGYIGCAIGHAPYAGIEIYEEESWGRYVTRVFGFVGKDSLFSFLFDSDWEYYDNTATGVSKRIDYFLDPVSYTHLTLPTTPYV